ncbi:uncharacterized protein LOC122568302 [Bombus pyrosoma]|uniref:uncharacterized protein LOC122568302 n=1 Tax=Bombus pyrosoma TaxID=396416 RepID=UPI001CB9ACF4|nr:uncharacterized protein LOC122568302 [Bombus pyrosoma]
MLDTTKEMASRDVAPGPDEVPGRIWAETMAVMAPRLRHLFTRCRREGVYPRIWCMTRLVLLRKEGRPTDWPTAYLPVCLLNEVGKLLRNSQCRLSGGPHVKASARLARKPVRLPAEPLDGGCGELGTRDVTGHGFLGWSSAGSLFKHS